MIQDRRAGAVGSQAAPMKVFGGRKGPTNSGVGHSHPPPRPLLSPEGLRGFYRGFVPAVARQCPVIVVQMPLIEQLRRFAGLDHI